MKLAIIGGGGVRTPLLSRGLARAGLGLTELALYDPDPARLARMAAVARALISDDALRLTTHAEVAPCVDGARFVVTSIRPGGVAARAADEAAALALGLLGQETIGPVGFHLALRTIPPMVALADEITRRAPDAWIVSFTNPVGAVTQAMTTRTGARVIGICDTPLELCAGAAAALDLDPARCAFDYVGLNHLGWLREISVDGWPQLHRLWDDPARLARVFRTPLFDLAAVAAERLLPSEYVYYYAHTARAVANLRKAGTSRGAAIVALNDALFADLAAPGADLAAIYRRYIETRNAGYMALETGADGPIDAPSWAELTGYDRVGVEVIAAIVGQGATATVLPLNVPNAGNVPELAPDDVVEIPCLLDANGARPLHVGPLPATVRDLVLEVKRYERLVIDAALERSPELARRALASHPLVGAAGADAFLAAAESPW